MANNVLAYGFVDLASLMAERVTTTNMAQVFDAVRASTAEHTRQINAMMASFVSPTTEYSTRYHLAAQGTLQPLDEHGNPRPVIEAGYWDVAFPIFDAGTAWGTDRVTRAKETVDDVNRHVLGAMQRDADWMRRHMLAALFYEANWTYADPLYGSLTIKPLANGDTDTYVMTDGVGATDDHYLAQAAAIADATNPFDDIYEELMEHPSNANAQVVVYVPTALLATTRALTAFIERDPSNVRVGVNTSVMAGEVEVGPGHRFEGMVNDCAIVHWRNLPATHMVATARGADPALRMRQEPEAALQGFFTEEFDVDGNHQGIRMLRRCGFGVANRTAAVVQYIGSGTYAEPTGYDVMPLAI
jgi:hypothetical protein